jgi:acylphosphatase
VRNRRNGSVEAVFAGPSDVVSGMIEACRVGPRAAVVLEVVPVSAPDPPAGFRVLATD